MHVPDQMFAAGNQSDRYGQGHSLFTVTMTKKSDIFFFEGWKTYLIYIWPLGHNCGYELGKTHVASSLPKLTKADCKYWVLMIYDNTPT